VTAASILVVDDDEAFRHAVCRTLRAAGHAVEETDGGHALRVLDGEAPDLLITDLIMPDHDGIELILAVKRTWPAVKILAMSGRRVGGVSLLNMAGRLGADGTLDKPFSNDELLATVAALVGSAPTA